MNVIRSHQFQPKIFRPLNEVAVDFGLLWNAMVLQFEIEVARAERLLEPVDRIARFCEIVVLDKVRDLAGEATRESDQAFAALGQNLFVDAWFVIVALEVR